ASISPTTAVEIPAAIRQTLPETARVASSPLQPGPAKENLRRSAQTQADTSCHFRKRPWRGERADPENQHLPSRERSPPSSQRGKLSGYALRCAPEKAA